MYKQEHSRTTNSSEACGLRTHFYTGHMGDAVPPVISSSYLQLMLNKKRLLQKLNVALVLCRFQCKLQSVCVLQVRLAVVSEPACRDGKMHESVEVKLFLNLQENN